MTTGQPRQLSMRERDILALLWDGKSQKQIAADLSLSPKTVTTHMVGVYRKLGAHSAVEAVRAGLDRGYLHYKRPQLINGDNL